MKIFSKTIQIFTKKCEGYLKDILSQEVGCAVARSRFTFNSLSLPLRVVSFESKSTIGYFDPHTYQIGLNQKLMFGTKEKTLKDILRHELAHYFNFIESHDVHLPHGVEFKRICERYGWGQLISKASIDIDLTDSNLEGDIAAEKLKRKFKALLKLSSSDNPHEAELATIKANQLLLKYNLDKLDEDIERPIYSKILLTNKKKNSKMIAIYDILSTFMIRPILIYGYKQVSLEVCGSKENIELAEYVASFLEIELESLWSKNNLKGLKAKNSYFSGIAKGYLEKNLQAQDSFDKKTKTDLIVLENKLKLKMDLVYPRLSHTSSKSSLDSNAFKSGKKAGNSLTINQVLKNKAGKIKLLAGL